MFDPTLQMRFWRNVSDAMSHSTEAAFATANIWQQQMLGAAAGQAKPQQTAGAATPFLFWPFQLPQPAVQTLPASAWPYLWWLQQAPQSRSTYPLAISSSSFNAMAPWGPWADFYRQSFELASPNGPLAQWAKTFAPFFPWPMMTWAMTQTPLTAMLMSSGVPYSVASPSAKAGTYALDAAEAAREQMQQVYAAYRSDGGHAAAQIVTLPWTIAASFMTGGKLGNPSIMQIN